MSPLAVPAALHPEPIAPLRDGEFRRFQQLIEAESGIHLSEQKRALVVGRLSRRIRELRLGSFGAYLERVVADPAERVRMLDAIATNETHFFREPQHFTLLQQRLLPQVARAAAAGERPRTFRIWSAGCSTGEEPYSLAMLLLDVLDEAEGWTLEIVATDLSTRVLERAEAGLFSIERAREIPPEYLKRYMLRGTGAQQGRMKADERLRRLIRFDRVNLHGTDYPPGPFDAIFCRNVLIYFEAKTRVAVVGRLLQRLAPGGHLFLGHAETLNGHPAPVRNVIPTVYARLDGSERP